MEHDHETMACFCSQVRAPTCSGGVEYSTDVRWMQLGTVGGQHVVNISSTHAKFTNHIHFVKSSLRFVKSVKIIRSWKFTQNREIIKNLSKSENHGNSTKIVKSLKFNQFPGQQRDGICCSGSQRHRARFPWPRPAPAGNAPPGKSARRTVCTIAH